MGIRGPAPFVGEDVWTGYELSWLSPAGVPRVGALRLRVDAASPRMVESKSMKIYLNGFAQTRFDFREAVSQTLERDLTKAVGAPVALDVLNLEDLDPAVGVLPGECLDGLDVAADVYDRDPTLLSLADPAGEPVEEALHTHLFRSLCPVTGQPDWASVLIRYRGSAMDRGSLLRYLVSFRCHQAFHENTVERMFLDLKDRCGCERLLVAGYFLRRGGLDINPYRADPGEAWPAMRLVRQ